VSLGDYEYLGIYQFLRSLPDLLRDGSQQITVRYLLGRFYAGIPLVFCGHFHRSTHRRWLFPPGPLCRLCHGCNWNLHDLFVHSVLAIVPGARHMLWSREWMSVLSLYQFAEYVFLEEEEFGNGDSSRWKRDWCDDLPGYGATASPKDWIPVDHKSSGVYSTGMFYNLLHWVEATSPTEEGRRPGRLGEFQRGSISFVCHWDVLRKCSFLRKVI
jgi:hypothetical protein